MTALSMLQLLPDAAGLSGNINLDGTNLLRLTDSFAPNAAVEWGWCFKSR